jgi:hypothetical protein
MSLPRGQQFLTHTYRGYQLAGWYIERFSGEFSMRGAGMTAKASVKVHYPFAYCAGSYVLISNTEDDHDEFEIVDGSTGRTLSRCMSTETRAWGDALNRIIEAMA